MNRKLKKKITGLFLVLMTLYFIPFGPMTAWADTKVSFKDPSVMVGNEVTVTMKVTSDSSLGTAQFMLSYDPQALQFISGTNANGDAGAIKVLGTMEAADQKSFQFILKFKALRAGATQIAVTDQEIYDMDSQVLNPDHIGSSTITVTSPANYSKDATLKSLKISPGTLNPEFSTAVDSYTASVDGNTTDLVVNAVASNAGAKVALQGEKGLKTGENQVVLTVTAEDGQTIKTYTIHVTKAEGGETVPAAGTGAEDAKAQFGDVTATVGQTEYRIANYFDEAALPEGFEPITYDYKGNEVMAGKGLEKDLLLLYLQDSGGNGGFFIYDEKEDKLTKFIQVMSSSKAIVILPLAPEITSPEGFIQKEVSLGDATVNGWVVDSEAEPEYYLLYAMNWEGEKNFYRYDIKEQTIQRYFASGISREKYMEMVHTYNELTGDYHTQFYILIGVSALAVLLIIVLLVLLLRREKNGPGQAEEKELVKGKRFIKDNTAVNEDAQDEEEAAVRRYARDEFARQMEETGTDQLQSKDPSEPEEEEDDFAIETSLEEMEEALKSQENNSQAVQKKTSPEEEEDFEFLDLEDH